MGVLMQFYGLVDLLKSANSVDEIDKYKEEIAELIPSVRGMFDFDQQNHAHQYDLWFHSLHTVVNLPKGIDDDMLYLAALLHDIGKPEAQCSKEGDPNKHYYGHAEVSERIVCEECEGYLCFEDLERLLYYVRYHDDRVSLKLKHTRRHLKIVSFGEFRNLMLLEVADAKAHILEPAIQNRIDICQKLYDKVAFVNYMRIQHGE